MTLDKKSDSTHAALPSDPTTHFSPNIHPSLHLLASLLLKHWAPIPSTSLQSCPSSHLPSKQTSTHFAFPVPSSMHFRQPPHLGEHAVSSASHTAPVLVSRHTRPTPQSMVSQFRTQFGPITESTHIVPDGQRVIAHEGGLGTQLTPVSKSWQCVPAGHSTAEGHAGTHRPSTVPGIKAQRVPLVQFS